MKHLPARTVPVALALAFLSAASFAEQRPNTTLVQKSKVTAAQSSPAAKARTPAATPIDAASTTKAGARQGAPSAGSATTAAEPSYSGCHGKDIDA